MSKKWKKHNFQVRYALYVKDHLTGEKSGQKFGMKWNIVLMLVKKKITVGAPNSHHFFDCINLQH